MISAFANIFRIPELKKRVLFTLGMIVFIRLGAAIAVPGVDAGLLADVIDQTRTDEQGGMMALINIFSGGALQQAAIFALGIMPYISAAIMMQLMTAVFPRLAKLRREDGGQQKITQYTRYITLALCLFQGYLFALALENPGSSPFFGAIANRIPEGAQLVPNPGLAFRMMTVVTLTTGTMFLMWMGDQITDRGIGQGVSLIITVNIMAGLPAALVNAWQTFVTGGEGAKPMILVVLVAFLVGVVAAVIAITQAVRKISVHYTKRVVGRKVMGGQTQYLPLKVNYAGVMPIIFAQALILFPVTIASMMFPNEPWVGTLQRWLNAGVGQYIFMGVMIFFFSYFWVATQFQPTQISEDLKKAGGYIPGKRPGKPTAEFLDYTMTRLTFAGAIFLTFIAIIPMMMSDQMGVPMMTAQFFGGTSILIMVGVLLDTMRQVETHLIQRHYDGFLRKGKLRSRSQQRRGGSSARAVQDKTLVYMYASLAALILLFVVILIMRGV